MDGKMMPEYGMEMILETESQYKTIKLQVGKLKSPDEAEAAMKDWIDKHPQLLKKSVNKEIRHLVFEE